MLSIMKACVFPGVFVPLLIVHCRAQFRDLDGCTAADLEACGTDYVIYANATRIAEGGEELEQQCRFFLSQLSCMDKFCSRCLVGITRAVALVGLRSAHEFYDESCWNGTSLYKDYIDSVRCLNKAGPRIHDQLTDVRLKLHSIAETVPGREKVKYACCTYNEFLHSTGKVIIEACPDPVVAKFYMALMERSFGDMLTIACGGYSQGSPECLAIGPVIPSKTLKPEDAQSFVGPMIAIIDALGRS